MVFITEPLIRRRAEHNECVISSLEELSLHQQDIERIENIDKWCRDLRILYLQSNLIPRIENVSRLKKLDYLNLALNNIERVENLEGCESLRKLDLTVNFIGDLTSVECLQDLYNFRELFLTGNPCTNYEGYREFVIATLPQLKYLDGTEIEKSERILACQQLSQLRPKIIEQQEAYQKEREQEKEEARLKEERKRKKKPGFDGRWYTDIDNTCRGDTIEDTSDLDTRDEEAEEKFWEEKVPFTPESRVQIHEHLQEVRKRENPKEDGDAEPKPRKLQGDDGRILNVNEPKVDFKLTEDEEHSRIQLDVAVFRHMDTSLCDVDVQPTYVRVTLKGKILQLCLPEEVKPDSSTAQRSQTTGHLLVTMPKANPVIQASVPKKHLPKIPGRDKPAERMKGESGVQRLEVGPTGSKNVDLFNIVKDPSSAPIVAPLGSGTCRHTKERPNSDDFVDDPDVPPLI